MVHGLKLINHQSNQDAFSGVQNPQPKSEQHEILPQVSTIES